MNSKSLSMIFRNYEQYIPNEIFDEIVKHIPPREPIIIKLYRKHGTEDREVIKIFYPQPISKKISLVIINSIKIYEFDYTDTPIISTNVRNRHGTNYISIRREDLIDGVIIKKVNIIISTLKKHPYVHILGLHMSGIYFDYKTYDINNKLIESVSQQPNKKWLTDDMLTYRRIMSDLKFGYYKAM